MTSGSSFDSLPEAQEASLSQPATPTVSFYDSCARLFSHYRKSDIRIKRGFRYRNGEAEPTSHDFCADITLKAKRVLTPREYALFDVFSRDADTVNLLPRGAQDKLNVAFAVVFHDYLPLLVKAQHSHDAEVRREARQAMRQAEREAQQADQTAQQDATRILSASTDPKIKDSEIDVEQMLNVGDLPFAANL